MKNKILNLIVLENMYDNHNIINEYNITYNNSTTMVRNNINQIYNNSEFIQEYEHITLIQEYENELRREQELTILNRQINEQTQQMIELYVYVSRLRQSRNLNENIVSEIDRIETEEYENINDEIINSYLQDGEELIETCSICIEDVVNVESTSKLCCGHHFHTNCIKLCLKRNRKCPLCRRFCLRNY